MKCVTPTIEANSYSRTIATFMAHKPLEELLNDAFLSGYKCAIVKHKIDDKKFEKETKHQPTLFEWAAKGARA